MSVESSLFVEYASLRMYYSVEKDNNLNIYDVISTCQSCQSAINVDPLHKWDVDMTLYMHTCLVLCK